MIRVLIGHRGSGKTSFLRRIADYFLDAGHPVVTADLDQLIQSESARSIATIFAEEGEAGFRVWEQRVFSAFIQKHLVSADPVFLSVGAGFQGDIPEKIECLWVRRVSDSLGRIFIDRPRLNAAISPLEEYWERFPVRDQRYEERADWIWTVLEGWDHSNPIERDFILGNFSSGAVSGRAWAPAPRVAGVVTVASWWADRAEQRILRKEWRGLRFELRDDLLSWSSMDALVKQVGAARIIFSFREKRPSPANLKRVLDWRCVWDWPLELGALPSDVRPGILSLHERTAGESVRESAERLSNQADHFGLSSALLKFAPEVLSFSELKEGWLWAAEDPGHRVFLPRSSSSYPGRWAWYRLWMLPQSPLSFIREGASNHLDQPLLMEVLLRQKVTGMQGGFAAVLGDPVLQSRTPAEQFAFFSERGMPVLSIAVTESEWDEALPILQEMGLRAAAVTAPLKKRAARSCDHAHGRLTSALNTLFWSESSQRWLGTNTDLRGFEALLKPFRQASSVGVWGGGGTLDVIRAILPQAVFFSSRSGHVREGEATRSTQGPQQLIWAVGALHGGTLVWPPESWKPETIIDLNYAEDSPGREYALRTGANYISGLKMFEVQAEGQRIFWSECEVQEESNQ